MRRFGPWFRTDRRSSARAQLTVAVAVRQPASSGLRQRFHDAEQLGAAPSELPLGLDVLVVGAGCRSEHRA